LASTAAATLPTAPVANSPAPGVENSTTTSPAVETVQLTAAPGQYRPGGTTSYSPSALSPAVEVASRPSAPVSTNPQNTTGTPTSATGSEPWSPPTSVPTTPGTRLY
jgi:hypothetical protein